MARRSAGDTGKGRGTGKDSPGDRLRRNGWQRGLMGGSMAWTAVAAATYGWKAMRWALKPEDPAIIAEAIAPGETIQITHYPLPPTRRQRRKDRKRQRKTDRKQAKRDAKVAKREEERAREQAKRDAKRMRKDAKKAKRRRASKRA